MIKDILNKVVFYFPWKEISGGPFYLTKLADALSEIDGYQVYYIDYPNGLTSKMIKSKKVIRIAYNDVNFNLDDIKDPIILVTPIYWAFRVPFLQNDKSKVLFFNWHYCCLDVLRYDSGWSEKFLLKFLKKVCKTDSCFFLDNSHLDSQNIKGIKFKDNFVPIILKDKKVKAKGSIVNQKELNIGVLGRIDGDKMYSCLNILDNLFALDFDKTVNVHFVGDGVHRKFFEEECKKASYSKKLNIIMHGTLLADDLTKFLCNDIDVLFAMGTSVLEGASLSLPSVIIPSNTQKFYENCFVYVFNSNKYSLGWFSTQIPNMNIKPMKIGDIINDIYVKGLKKEYGIKCYNYFKENHISNIDSFVNAVERNKLTFADYLALYKRPFIENLFYIKKKPTQRDFNILGIKFHVRRKNEILKQHIQNVVNNQAAFISNRILELENKLNVATIASSFQSVLFSDVNTIQRKTFEGFKNTHSEDVAVIIASGSTVRFYNDELKIKKAFNVAINGAMKLTRINFNYFFAYDYDKFKDVFDKGIPSNLKNAIKFYGKDLLNNQSSIPEQFLLRDNANRFFTYNPINDLSNPKLFPFCNFAENLECEPLLDHSSTSIIALQFLLYCNFKTIYLVGCDTTNDGYFYDLKNEQKNRNIDAEILGWKKIADFASENYPLTKIISINPVNLKGIFNDVYTRGYLNLHSDIKNPVLLEKHLKN